METLKFVGKYSDVLASLAIHHIEAYSRRGHSRHPDVEIKTRLLESDETPNPWDVLIMGAEYLSLPREDIESLGWQMGHICLAAHQIHQLRMLPGWAKDLPFVVIVRNLPGREFRTSYSQAVTNSYCSYAEKGFIDAPWGAFCEYAQREAVRSWIQKRDEALALFFS